MTCSVWIWTTARSTGRVRARAYNIITQMQIRRASCAQMFRHIRLPSTHLHVCVAYQTKFERDWTPTMRSVTAEVLQWKNKVGQQALRDRQHTQSCSLYMYTSAYQTNRTQSWQKRMSIVVHASSRSIVTGQHLQQHTSKQTEISPACSISTWRFCVVYII